MLLKTRALRSLGQLKNESICIQCLHRISRPKFTQDLHRSSIHTKRKLHGAVVPDKEVQRNMLVTPQTFMHDYFSANDSIDRGWVKNGLLAAWRTVSEPSVRNRDSEHSVLPVEAQAPKHYAQSLTVQKGDASVTDRLSAKSFEPTWDTMNSSTTLPSTNSIADNVLPHRRRKLLREQESSEPIIPPDASSQLTTTATNLPSSASLRRMLATYLSLTKPRLSFLVVLTTTTAFSLYPIPDILATTSDLSPATVSTSTLTLLFLTTGTFLSSACANTLNMLMEPKHDALMSRTRNRPLVRKLLSRRAAAMFALLSGVAGLTLLDLGTNSTVAFLSALNIFLYAGIYTPLKRLSVVNTWAGALVGGIPPLMGWAAAAGQAATSEHHSWKDLLFSEDSVGGWLLAGLLFAWQFPHFNAISHTIKDEYRHAGFKMLAWTNPAMNGRVAIRYSLAMFPICAGLWWAGIVNGGFMVISTACNAWMTREAFRFWRKGGGGGSARGLFWSSVWQLPLVMVGALVCKKGIWDGMFEYNENEDSMREEDAIAGDKIGEEALNMGGEKGTKPYPINLAMMGFKRPS